MPKTCRLAAASAAIALAVVFAVALPGAAQTPSAQSAGTASSDRALTAAEQQELSQLFQRVLANPADKEANYRYAEAAERFGQRRKALATYERMALNDPDDTRARASYERLKLALEPTNTRFRLGFGLQYDSNASALNNGLSPTVTSVQKLDGKDDVAAVASFRVDDERPIGDFRWRSKAQLYGEAHFITSKNDFHYASVDTGPVFVLPNSWIVRPGLGTEVGFHGYNYLFWAAGPVLDIDFPQPGMVKTARFSAMRADFTKEENSRDGWVFAGRVEIGWDDVFTKGDALTIEPFGAYFAAQGFNHQDRYAQVGVTLSYVVPVADNVLGFRKIYAAPEISVDYRPYAGRETLPASLDKGDRRDWRLLPGLRIIGTEMAGLPVVAILSYEFDRTRSNYKAYAYDNHRVALNFVWNF